MKSDVKIFKKEQRLGDATNKFPRWGVLLLICLFMTILNISYLKSGAEPVFKSILSPIEQISSATGRNTRNAYKTVTEISSLSRRVDELELENIRLQSENAAVKLIEEERFTLSKQLSLGNSNWQLEKALVLDKNFSKDNEILYISSGKSDGLKDGDIAVIGNLYIGTLFDVQEGDSKVRLPTNEASFLEVSVFQELLSQRPSADMQSIYQTLQSQKGVANGQLSNIVVENVERDAPIAKDNEVFVTDSKVGQFLYLGRVVTVEASPSQASQSLIVNSPVDFFNLKYIFIIKSND